MIRITKSAVPDLFKSVEFRAAIAAFEQKQKDDDISTRRQSRAKALFPHRHQLKQALLEESHGKCVYCEQRLTASRPLEIDRFRPARGAMNAQGNRSEDHYYWLAYDWDNLYASCLECNYAKATKFPVASERVPPHIHGDLDAIEKPLILNPARCNPEDHLEFHYDGKVTPKTIRGQHTIDIFRLNRASLVEARAAHVMKLEMSEDLIHDCSDSAEFAALSRQVVSDYPTRFQRPGKPPKPPIKLADLLSSEPTPQHKQDGQDELISQDNERYYSTYPLVSSIVIDGLCGLSALAGC